MSLPLSLSQHCSFTIDIAAVLTIDPCHLCPFLIRFASIIRRNRSEEEVRDSIRRLINRGFDGAVIPELPDVVVDNVDGVDSIGRLTKSGDSDVIPEPVVDHVDGANRSPIHVFSKVLKRCDLFKACSLYVEAESMRDFRLVSGSTSDKFTVQVVDSDKRTYDWTFKKGKTTPAGFAYGGWAKFREANDAKVGSH